MSSYLHSFQCWKFREKLCEEVCFDESIGSKPSSQLWCSDCIKLDTEIQMRHMTHREGEGGEVEASAPGTHGDAACGAAPTEMPWWEQKSGSDDSGFTAIEPSDIEDFVAWSDAEVAKAYAAGEDLPQTREATGFGSQRFGYYTGRNNHKGVQ